MEQSDEQDEEPITLSSSALDALSSFYSERDARLQEFEDLKLQAEQDAGSSTQFLDMETLFAEDWNASQFWYSEATAQVLAQELLSGCSNDTRIAIISAPSAFVQIKNILNSTENETVRPQLTLLEYDQRFNVFKEFVPYDFEHALRLPTELKGKFHRIICDPPFLSEDCQTKMALTVRWLAKSWKPPLSKDDLFNSGENSSATADEDTKIIICTGERMSSLVSKLYGKAGVRLTTFEPEHSKGLSNEFQCLANYESNAWKWAL